MLYELNEAVEEAEAVKYSSLLNSTDFVPKTVLELPSLKLESNDLNELNFVLRLPQVDDKLENFAFLSSRGLIFLNVSENL